MKFFICIMGVLMAFCGIALATTPLITFWETSYFFVALLILYGVGAIARSYAKKELSWNLLFGILSIAAGLAILFVPGMKVMTSSTIIYMMAVWFLLQGVVSLLLALRARKSQDKEKKWFGTLLMGIITLVLGIYSLFHPVALAFSVGMLVGIYFIIAGINLLILGIQLNKKPR